MRVLWSVLGAGAALAGLGACARRRPFPSKPPPRSRRIPLRARARVAVAAVFVATRLAVLGRLLAPGLAVAGTARQLAGSEIEGKQQGGLLEGSKDLAR